MKNINKSIAMMIKIAKKLDDKNLFYHSDKLFKIAQQAAATPPAQNIILNSDSPDSFYKNLVDFAKLRGLTTIGDAMNAYADAKATYAGKPINQSFILKAFYINNRTVDINLSQQHTETLNQEFAQAQANQEQNLKDGKENVEILLDAEDDPEGQAEMEAEMERSRLLDTYSPESFVEKLFEFAQLNSISNLAKAFDAYANAYARFRGVLINSHPALKELYMRVRNTPRLITNEELVGELKMLIDPKGEMADRARKNRTKMTAEQAYSNFTEAIEKAKTSEELSSLRVEIYYFSNDLFSVSDKINLQTILSDKESDIIKQKDQDASDHYKDYYDLAQSHPLVALETLKAEITNNLYLKEEQKDKLIEIVDKRLTKGK